MKEYKIAKNGIWISRNELENMRKKFLKAYEDAKDKLPYNCFEAAGKAYLCQDLINIIDRAKSSLNEDVSK